MTTNQEAIVKVVRSGEEMKTARTLQSHFHSPQGVRKSMFKKCGKIGKTRKGVMGGEL